MNTPAHAPYAQNPTDLRPIEELAAQAGMSVRNIRAYNSAGLLPPPTMKGRLGLYDDTHLAQLQVVGALRRQGISLDRIKQLVHQNQASGDGSVVWQRLRTLAQTLAQCMPPAEEPAPQPPQDVAAQWQQPLSADLAQQMVRSGLMRVHPDGAVQHLSADLQETARQVAKLGIPLQQAVAAQDTMSRNLRHMMRMVLQLLLDDTLAARNPAQRQRQLRRLPKLLEASTRAMLPVILQQEAQRLGGLAQGGPAATP